MIRRLLSIVLGAALVLQFERWWETRRARYSPNALTGSLLDKVNTRLERKQGRA
jgi:hypothetical protein